MKQKNLIMLGVAMACGLVAAIAVAKLSAGGDKGPEMGKVLVAKKDIPLSTKLDEKDLDTWIMWTDMPKSMIPPDAVTDLDVVKNKEVNRTLKAGNAITVTDVGVSAGITLPDGCKQITVKVAGADAVEGFARPGSKVDVIFVEKLPSGKSRSAQILRDMLVLAVGKVDQLKEGTGRAIAQVESISLAVSDKQAHLLTHAEDRGRLKFVLRGPNHVDAKKFTEGKIEWEDNPLEIDAGPSLIPSVAKEPTETIVYAKKAVPLNTLLNAENVAEFFGTLDVKTVPDGAFKQSEDLKGLYVVRALEPGQNLLRVAVAKAPIDVETTETPAGPVVKAVEPAKLPRFESVIQEGGVARRLVWLETAPGKWKRFDSVKAADEYIPDAPAKADAKPADETKPTGDGKPVGN